MESSNELEVQDSYNIPDGSLADDVDEYHVRNMRFDSIDDAEKFYNLYAKCGGFTIRKDDIKRIKDSGFIAMRKWVCDREGFRDAKWLNREETKREPRPLTRVGCPAMFRVKYQKSSGKFIVTDFLKQHNHPLASNEAVMFLRSHRSVTSGDLAQASAMQEVGLKTSQIIKLLAHQSGSYSKVGIVIKDLYNYLDAERRAKIKDGDAECALVYLRANKDQDPYLYYKYEIDEHNRLSKLFLGRWKKSNRLQAL